MVSPFKKTQADRGMEKGRTLSLTDEIEIRLIRFSGHLDGAVMDAI